MRASVGSFAPKSSSIWSSIVWSARSTGGGGHRLSAACPRPGMGRAAHLLRAQDPHSSRTRLHEVRRAAVAALLVTLVAPATAAASLQTSLARALSVPHVSLAAT